MQVVGGQPLPHHHVLQHGDVRGDIHGLVAEQAVQLLFKGLNDAGHHAFHLLHGAGDVFTADALAAHLVVGRQQLDGGGQVVGHELPDLGQLGWVVLHVLEDAAADLLQPVDLGGDGLVLNAVVQGAHGLNSPVAVGDHLIQLGIAGGHRFLGDLHLLRHVLAEDAGDQRHHGSRRRSQWEMSHLIQGEQQCVQHPRHRRGVDGRGRFVDDGLCFQSCRLQSLVDHGCFVVSL